MRRLFLLVPIVALLTAPPAQADEHAGSVHYPQALALYLGPYGGGHLPLRTWDFGAHDRISLNEPGSSGLLGLRIGLQVLSRLALEAELAWLPVPSTLGGTNDTLSYSVGLIFHLLRGRWTPLLEAGFGGYSLLRGDLGADADPRAHLGVGFRGLLTDWLAFRVDCRDVFSDGPDSGGANNLELTVGLDFFAWRGREAPPDRDGDGVADAQDACPNLAGTAATRGCPDADRDRIRDGDDRCPQQAGPEATGGCPDGDGDGIADAEDRCPAQAGPEATGGCPDGDGDGITDGEDRCPTLAGPAEHKGCPDKDGDGIADLDDRCPEVKGVKEQQGCMPEVVAKKFSGAIKGITFATGSAKILKPSFGLLDEAVAVLKEYPTLKLAIEGHTDNVGKPEKNQKLSQARADAVRDYLTAKGIEGTRIQATGFGDTRPAEDNKTRKGRAANRRIEFKVSAD